MATIIEQINELQQAKEAIQDAVVAKGGTVSGDTLAGLADDIMDIPQSADFDWSSIGYTGMPAEIRADLEETAAIKAAWDAMPANRKSNIFQNNTRLMYFPEDIDVSLLSTNNYMFSGMYNLRSIPAGLDFINATTAFRFFYQCYAFRTLPNDFSLPNVTAINTFINSPLIQSIPDNFLPHPENITAADNAFQGCTSLLALPECVCEMENVTTIQAMVSGCSSLTEVTFTGQYDRLVNAQNVFYNCSKLQKASFPLSMFKNCTTVSSLFQSCEQLYDFPTGKIDLSTATNIGNIFYQCKALRSLWLKIPNAVQNQSGGICYNCISLTWLRLDDCNVNLVNNCVNQCPLSADGVYNLIDSLADRTGLSSLTCTLSATAKANMSAETAALAASKNWTIA